MLKAACQEFRRRYADGLDDGHGASCAACGAWARSFRTAGEAQLDLPPGPALRRALREIPDAEERRTLSIEPVPRLPLPERLRRRLCAIARAGRAAEPPAWVRSPRAAIAASYALTVALGLAAGNPAARVEEALERLKPRAEASWVRVNGEARGRVEKLERAARATYQQTAGALGATFAETRNQIRVLAGAVKAAGGALLPEPEAAPAENPKGADDE